MTGFWPIRSLGQSRPGTRIICRMGSTPGMAAPPQARARAELCRSFTDLTPTSLLLGVVATNQARKDWRLAAETCRILLERGHDVRLWAHTDGARGWWDLPRLFDDHGLKGRVAITTFQLSDAQMTWMYSACDVTLGIGLGEGSGIPLPSPGVWGSGNSQTLCRSGEYMPESLKINTGPGNQLLL